jgi:hypothetical protein
MGWRLRGITNKFKVGAEYIAAAVKLAWNPDDASIIIAQTTANLTAIKNTRKEKFNEFQARPAKGRLR